MRERGFNSSLLPSVRKYMRLFTASANIGADTRGHILTFLAGIQEFNSKASVDFMKTKQKH